MYIRSIGADYLGLDMQSCGLAETPSRLHSFGEHKIGQVNTSALERLRNVKSLPRRQQRCRKLW